MRWFRSSMLAPAVGFLPCEAGEGDHAKHGGGGGHTRRAKMRAPILPGNERALRREMTQPERTLWSLLRESN
jgi:hypothetical protein